MLAQGPEGGIELSVNNFSASNFFSENKGLILGVVFGVAIFFLLFYVASYGREDDANLRGGLDQSPTNQSATTNNSNNGPQRQTVSDNDLEIDYPKQGSELVKRCRQMVVNFCSENPRGCWAGRKAKPKGFEKNCAEAIDLESNFRVYDCGVDEWWNSNPGKECTVS